MLIVQRLNQSCQAAHLVGGEVRLEIGSFGFAVFLRFVMKEKRGPTASSYVDGITWRAMHS